MELVGVVVSWVVSHWDVLSGAVLALLSAAALVARLTPNTKDDAVVARIRKVVGWVFNMRKQVPVEEPAPKQEPEGLFEKR